MSAMKLNIDSMPYVELQALHESIGDALKKSKSREIATVRRELAEVAKRHGYDLRDVLPQRRRTSPASEFPKYVNPHNESQTWSGRGRKPRWLTPEIVETALAKARHYQHDLAA